MNFFQLHKAIYKIEILTISAIYPFEIDISEPTATKIVGSTLSFTHIDISAFIYLRCINKKNKVTETGHF